MAAPDGGAGARNDDALKKRGVNAVKIHMERLTPEQISDYLYFFDHVAFTDHEAWSMCYCLEGSLTQAENDALSDREARRERARQLITQGTLCGYLVYAEDKVVGWCNAADKDHYPMLCACEYDTKLPLNAIRVLYCMEIAPAWRGKGIAHQLVERVCADARADGKLAVEAYPFSDEQFAWQYRGPRKLYEHHGFTLLAQHEWLLVMRKLL